MSAPVRRPLMAGNWKMNLNHLEALKLVQQLEFSLTEKQLTAVEVVVLPPFTDIRSVQTLIDGDKLLLGFGAQDVSVHEAGAYTGEISGSMLAKLGCQYVLVGHSERREYHHETDEIVNAKLKAAFKHDLTPILCVGEGLDVREADGHIPHCHAQVDGALAGIKAEQVAAMVIAYEPIWAIGTGRTATPSDAQAVIAAIRTRIGELYDQHTAESVRILYGGSVNAGNVAAIMAEKDIDGGLVGGASIKAEEFVTICRFPDHIAR